MGKGGGGLVREGKWGRVCEGQEGKGKGGGGAGG